jgi:hypothetical protein
VEHIDIIDHYHCSENLYFSVAFLDEVMGWRGCGFSEGFMKEQILLWRTFMCAFA